MWGAHDRYQTDVDKYAKMTSMLDKAKTTNGINEKATIAYLANSLVPGPT